jgi:hypothetical protein
MIYKDIPRYINVLGFCDNSSPAMDTTVSYHLSHILWILLTATIGNTLGETWATHSSNRPPSF